jgi:NAD(P)H-dependent nitrite reductase small subunit
VAEFISVAKVSELVPGTGTAVEVNGLSIALFKIDGAVYAIDNACPHRGGPLASGTVEGRVVTCPLHLWDFDIMTGEFLANREIRIPTYAVQVEGDDIKVAV